MATTPEAPHGKAGSTGEMLLPGPSQARAVGVGLAIGLLAAVLWSYEFVDDVIGGTIADTLLGFDAEERPSLDRPPGRCSPS